MIRACIHIIILLFIGIGIQAQSTELWGMTSEGGDGIGGIFKINSDGSDHEMVHELFTDGRTPNYTTLLHYNGLFYGMTSGGGADNTGIIYSYNPASSKYQKLYNFSGHANGIVPFGSLIEYSGKLYGMTTSGGVAWGVIFSYDIDSNVYSILHEFNQTEGKYPYGSLVEFGGKLYGMTSEGGTDGKGVIFRYDISGGTYNKLHDFYDNAGSIPYGSLMELGGKLYGMTSEGGSGGNGVIFRYDIINNIYSKLYDFPSVATNGKFPYGSLMEFSGKLYGMTSEGGWNGHGVIFSYDIIDSIYNKLHDLDYWNGGKPYGSLFVDNGILYGMTSIGGSSHKGVIFSYDISNTTYIKLHDFIGADGSEPSGTFVKSVGKLYAVTNTGGVDQNGIIFSYDINSNTHTKLHDFFYTGQGANPYGSLLGFGGKLYGMTNVGGYYNHGVLFSFENSNNTYEVLHDFGFNLDGAKPSGSLIESGGKLYGMTRDRGAYSNGVIFSYDIGSSVYTKLHDFNGVDGSSPYGSLMKSSGKLYGMTRYGGSDDEGVMFSYDIDSAIYMKLHDFNDVSGRKPTGSLLKVGSSLYGLTEWGGTYNKGVLFEYDITTGIYSKYYNFRDISSRGYNPSGSLIEIGGFLYGMTNSGGDHGYGQIYRFDPDLEDYDKLHSFENDSGRNPLGSLLEIDGILYGMTRHGGNLGMGVVFEYDLTGGIYSVLSHFNGDNGDYPVYGTLINYVDPGFIWTGIVSSDWTNPTNWDKLNVPSVNDAVYIKLAPHYPLITSIQSIQVAELDVELGAELLVDGELLVD